MKYKNKIVIMLIIAVTFTTHIAIAADSNSILFHLKTGLKHDDAQLCVAYNEIWAALKEGLKVDVLIDAGAVNTYKIGWWKETDKFEGYKLPQNLKEQLSEQFGLPIAQIPNTYGEYLNRLKKDGATFYINGAMLVVAGISKEFSSLEKISAKFFIPITLKEIIRLRAKAGIYMVY